MDLANMDQNKVTSYALYLMRALDELVDIV